MPHPVKAPDVPLIEFRDVFITRNETTALCGLTLSIGVGEHVAILGPNGSGKSTLIKAITRELYPRYGATVKILGQERWHVFDLRPLLGIVTNDLVQSCMREFKARDIVLSGFFSSIGVWPHHNVTTEMRAKTESVMERLEITHLADRWMDEVSSGEARRVAIARALVHDPRALLLDEPMNSLDLHAFRELRGVVRKLAQSGTSIILVTHHLPDVIPEIGRVVLLKEGRVFMDGAKEDVLRADLLAQLFGSGVELVQRDGYYNMW